MNSIPKNKKITLSWWNASLSPHSKDNDSSEEHKQYVDIILSRLFSEKNVDVLCLCEVSEQDVKRLRTSISETEFSVFDGTLREGRKKFDLCIIYRRSILTYISTSIISKLQITKKIYAGQEVNFLINDTGEPLALFLVHWSSRLYDYENSPTKIQLGTLLRDAINDCIDVRKIKHVITLGDFNEEPFNLSITEALFASRDIALVKKNPRLLYNPFWRHMISSEKHPDSQPFNSHAGTYYYKSDQVNRWKTFDQIIFSSDFIIGKSWFLNEEKTEVFSDEQFLKYINSSTSKFDHLPIISVIEKLNNEQLS